MALASFLCAPDALASGSATLVREVLPNGLRVLVSVDRDAPRATVAVAYLAGSADDPVGRRGTARLLERVMFGGSAGVRDGQHRAIVEALGGRAEVVRSAEVTSYVNAVPSRAVATALWLEAERMASSALARDVVERERAALVAELDATDESPLPAQARGWLVRLALQGAFGYGEDPLADVAAVEQADVRRFYEQRYGPARAVIAVVGDVDPEEVLRLCRRYFGGIERRVLPPEERSGRLAEQKSPRLSAIRARLALHDATAVGWAIDTHGRGDRAALELIAALLERRLEQRTTEPLSLEARLVDFTNAGVLAVVVELGRGGDKGAMASLIQEEATRLATSGPTAEELERARAAKRLRWLSERDDRHIFAQRLARSELVDGDANGHLRRLQAHAAVTADDVRSAARRWLGRHRASVVEVRAAPYRVSREGRADR